MGNIDSILITKSEIKHIECNPIENSEFSRHLGVVDYKSNRDNWIATKELIELVKQNPNNSASFVIDLFGTYFYSDEIDNSDQIFKSKKKVFCINMETYDSSKISSFCWQRGHGIIQYENLNGEIWKIIKSAPNKR